MNQPLHIVKEDLINLRFSSRDVLQDQALLNQREKDLDKALSLGNNDHCGDYIYGCHDAICRKNQQIHQQISNTSDFGPVFPNTHRFYAIGRRITL